MKHQLLLAAAGLVLFGVFMSVLVLLSSSMFIRDSAAMSILRLPLLLENVFTGRAKDDDFMVTRVLTFGAQHNLNW